MRELGARLRVLRKEQKLSQEALANRVGVERVTIWRIETGHPGVAYETVMKVCQELNVRVVYKRSIASMQNV